MRFNVIISAFILILVAASMGGATFAWFIADSENFNNVFVVGTVDISDPILTSSGQNWTPDTCQMVSWSMTNTGTKSSYFRVKLNEESKVKSETAWGIESGANLRFGGGNAQYFRYKIGSGVKEYVLGAGSSYTPVGSVTVWKSDGKLYVRYSTFDNVWLRETHLYAGLATPTTSAPGKLGWQHSFSGNNIHVDTYELSHIFRSQADSNPSVQVSTICNNTIIYIAAHATVETSAAGILTWTLTACDPQQAAWVKGTDGYWYYPNPVPAGETLSICFNVCLPDNSRGGNLNVYLDAEAVQASHHAIDYLWPNNPFR